MVSASSVNGAPSIASTRRSHTILTARDDDSVGVMDDRAGGVSRHQRAVGFVGAIGEDFRRDAETGGSAGGEDLRVGEAEEDERAIERGDGAGDGGGERRGFSPPC